MHSRKTLSPSLPTPSSSVAEAGTSLSLDDGREDTMITGVSICGPRD